MTLEDTVRSKILEFRNSRDKKRFVQYFTEDVARLELLMNHVWRLDAYPFKEYASWMFIHIAKSGRIDSSTYYNKLVDTLFKTEDQTVLRNVTYVLHEMKITTYRESDLLDLLIGFVQNHTNKVALQVYAIYLLIQFCEKYPELRTEIREIIELNAEGKTAAYRVAHRNFERASEKK